MNLSASNKRPNYVNSRSALPPFTGPEICVPVCAQESSASGLSLKLLDYLDCTLQLQFIVLQGSSILKNVGAERFRLRLILRDFLTILHFCLPISVSRSATTFDSSCAASM